MLSALGLSAEAIAKRRHSLGGSDANTIMGGNTDRIYRLWQEKRGEVEGDDLSGNLAVQMGSFTEPLNVAWFEKQTGNRVYGSGAMVTRDSHAYPIHTTLDGMVSDGNGDTLGIFEAKHSNTRATDAELFARYVPQLTHACIVTGETRAFLSVFKGNADWVMFEYALDDTYAAALIEAEAAFWQCVIDGTEPCAAPPVKTPKPVGVIEYDMTGNNGWADSAGDYLDTLLPAQRHELAKKDIKDMVPDDATLAAGHGLTVKRDKRGALRFQIEGASE